MSEYIVQLIYLQNEDQRDEKPTTSDYFKYRNYAEEHTTGLSDLTKVSSSVKKITVSMKVE